MAYSSTFSSLKTELQNYLEDSTAEYTAQQANIIARAQDRVQMDLNLEIWHETTSDTVGAAATSLTRPSGCMKVIYLYFPSAGIFAEKRTLAYCKAYGGSSTPKFYNDDSATTLYLAPANASSQSYELRQLTRVAALSDANTSNWISTNVPELLFHAAVVESEQFLKDEAKVKDANDAYAQRLVVDLDRFADLIHREYSLPQTMRTA
jgi:hypothetical protein